MRISAVICAAGKGTRAQLNKNKLLAPVYGAPVLYHVLKRFYPLCDEIIVTSSPDDGELINSIAKPFNATVVAGGETRFGSVYNALNAVTGDIVLIHDGARPFVSERCVRDCIDGVIKHRSAVCAVSATDTVAVCADGKPAYTDRAQTYLIQTPQGFFTEDIKSAYARAAARGGSYTDDGSVYAELFGAPHLCEGELSNVKLTYKSDFDRQYPALNAAEGQKIGYGADVHAFGADGDFITLLGERIPSNSGLVAHSDGDVAAHAVTDALLSAAGLYDIGHYFPDDDPAYLGADSMELLKTALSLVKKAGYAPLNASVCIQAEKPRLAKYIDGMKNNLAAALGIGADCAGISAGTCEGLGFVGEGLGICVTAAVLLAKKD